MAVQRPMTDADSHLLKNADRGITGCLSLRVRRSRLPTIKWL